MKERLQKLIAHSGIASRRAAEKMIVDGRVAINGTVVTELGIQADPKKCLITVDGKKLQGQEKLVYYMLNKPKGCVSTAKDERGRKTVLDLLPEVEERIYPVGRLDNDTEGLLLLMNDGNLVNALLHPRYEVYKTYMAKVSGDFTRRQMDMLAEGVELDDGMTAPAQVRIVDRYPDSGLTKVEIVIHEGRNRQVRRMFDAVGCEVVKLKRTEFAGLNLSGVHRGNHRKLTDEEVAYLYEVAGLEYTQKAKPEKKREYRERDNRAHAKKNASAWKRASDVHVPHDQKRNRRAGYRRHS